MFWVSIHRRIKRTMLHIQVLAIMSEFFRWLNDHKDVIWPTISPAILAVISLFFKTKKNDEDKLKDRLTIVGIAIVIFAIIGVIAGFQSQYKDSIEADSKAKNDSMLQASRHELVIKNFQTQRTLDSTQIRTDSNRYYTTISKIDQELNKQGVALTNIDKIVHPIFPMQISFMIQIKFDDITDSFGRNYVKQKVYGQLRKAKQKNPRVSALTMDGKNSDTLDQILKYYLPQFFSIVLSSDTVLDRYFDSGAFQTRVSQANYISSGWFDSQFGMRLSISYTLNNTDPPPAVLSLEACKKDFLQLEIANPGGETKYQFVYFNIKCGTTFPTEYHFKISDANIRTRVYDREKQYTIRFGGVRLYKVPFPKN